MMRGQVRRTIVIATAVTGMVLGGAVAAQAARDGNGPYQVQAGYGHISGDIHWYPRGNNHGGMGVLDSRLRDTAGDGRHVYAQARVAGYGYTTLRENHAGNGQTVNVPNKVIYDPAARIVSQGDVRVCGDHPLTDPCTTEHMTR